MEEIKVGQVRIWITNKAAKSYYRAMPFRIISFDTKKVTYTYLNEMEFNRDLQSMLNSSRILPPLLVELYEM
jgi:hypothetical protein